MRSTEQKCQRTSRRDNQSCLAHGERSGKEHIRTENSLSRNLDCSDRSHQRRYRCTDKCLPTRPDRSCAGEELVWSNADTVAASLLGGIQGLVGLAEELFR